ncbi:MAG: hypothetical protein OYG31_02875 [Candidatus Kaiserbacteria bacterium]|nr:hypothetical protein [Candidatus Kaiserbacteria bacterium]
MKTLSFLIAVAVITIFASDQSSSATFEVVVEETPEGVSVTIDDTTRGATTSRESVEETLADMGFAPVSSDGNISVWHYRR